jgi:prephenate dehydrogenase
VTVSAVLVVGTGLIGTSVGLALRHQGVTVYLADLDPARQQLAVDLGAGLPAVVAPEMLPDVDIGLLCVPPADVGPGLKRLNDLGLKAHVSDVASIKAKPQRDAEQLGTDTSHFVGGHPIAGRERGGPAMARADLFLGRPWVLTPSDATSPETTEAVAALVRLCGAVPVEMTAAAHDDALALISHGPQALASLLAAQLVDANPLTAQLAGQGLRDVTRIAESDPDLWSQIAAGNAGPIAAVLHRLAHDLGTLADTLQTPDGSAAAAAFRAVVAAGNAGRDRLPGKHGSRAASYTAVPVIVSDEPGALARLLTDAGDAGINVEDLSLEHSPGAPVGLCELFVTPAAADRLATVLTQRGWVVHHSPVGNDEGHLDG